MPTPTPFPPPPAPPPDLLEAAGRVCDCAVAQGWSYVVLAKPLHDLQAAVDAEESRRGTPEQTLRVHTHQTELLPDERLATEGRS